MSCPTLYDTPIDGMSIAKIDLLECLRGVLGDNCMLYRDMYYKLVSGSCSTQAEHIEIFASAYRRFRQFTEYVNNIYYYGETNIPIIPRVLNPIRDIIDDYKSSVMTTMSAVGGKFLMNTHDYLYYSFKNNCEIPEMKGLLIIC